MSERDDRIHTRAVEYGKYIQTNTGTISPELLAICLLLAREVQEVDDLRAKVARLEAEVGRAVGGK